jgi:diguanylate cyclase (GGDEF)-like protein/PAS domain S-box-containing protein
VSNGAKRQRHEEHVTPPPRLSPPSDSLPLLNESVFRATLDDPATLAITRTATAVLDVDRVFVCLLAADDGFEYSAELARMGVQEEALFRTLCQQAVGSEEPIAIADLQQEGLADGNPDPGLHDVAAYASVPLVTPEGHVLGSVCAVHSAPREWSAADLGVLADAATCIQNSIELRLQHSRVERNERYFRALVEHAQDVVTVLDVAGVIRYNSPSLTAVLGYAPGELLGRSAFDLIHPGDLPAVLDAFGSAVGNPGVTLKVEYRFLHQDGSWPVLESVGTALPDAEGMAVLVHSRDVTSRRRAELELKIHQAQLEQLFESAPEAIVLLDADDCVVRVNPEFTRLFGYEADEALGKAINDLIVPPAQAVEARAISRRVAEGETLSMDTVRSRKGGEPVDVSILATPIRIAGDRIGVFGIYRDISVRKRAVAQIIAQAKELRALSLTDELTGLYNRRGFFTLAEQELKLARDTGNRMVLLFLDVNGMKEINDTAGHAAGDRTLQLVADALRVSFRESDVLARMGGDEFAVLAWTGDGGSAAGMQSRLRDSLRVRPGTFGDTTISVSIGAAVWNPATERTLHALLADADRRMYEDKHG